MRYLARSTVLELKLLMRDPVTMVFTLALPVIVLYVLGAVFGNVPNPRVYRGVGPMDFYVPAYIGLALASMGFIGLPVHLAGYRERGILKRFRASDVPLWSVVGGQLAVTVVAGVAGSAILLAAAVVSYGVAMPRQPGFVVLAFFIGALSLGLVGVLLGSVMPNARAAQGAGVILWFVMMMLGGSGPPPEVLNETLRTVGRLTPLKHVVVMLQDPWLGWGWNAGEATIVVAFGLVSGLAAFAVLRYPNALSFLTRRFARRATG